MQEKFLNMFPVIGSITLPLSVLPSPETIIQTIVLAIVGGLTGILTKNVYQFVTKKLIKKNRKS